MGRGPLAGRGSSATPAHVANLLAPNSTVEYNTAQDIRETDTLSTPLAAAASCGWCGTEKSLLSEYANICWKRGMGLQRGCEGIGRDGMR